MHIFTAFLHTSSHHSLQWMAGGHPGPPGASARCRVGRASSLATASALIRRSRAAGCPVWAHTERTKSVSPLHVTVSTFSLDISQRFLSNVLQSRLCLGRVCCQVMAVGVSGAAGPSAPNRVVGGSAPGGESATAPSQWGRAATVRVWELRSSTVT